MDVGVPAKTTNDVNEVDDVDKDNNNIQNKGTADSKRLLIKPKKSCNDWIRAQAIEGYKAFLLWLDTEHPVFIFITVLFALIVVIAGAIVALAYIGALNSQYSEQQIFWILEVGYQILNAVFTVFCAYIFPARLINYFNFSVVTYGCMSQQKRDLYYSDLAQKFPWAIPRSSHDLIFPTGTRPLSNSTSIIAKPKNDIETETDADNRSKSVDTHTSVIHTDVQNENEQFRIQRAFSLGPEALERFHLEEKAAIKLWEGRWTALRWLLVLCVAHCLLQFVVALYFWLYGPYTRPVYFVAIFVPAILIGVGVGIWEGYLRGLSPLP